MGPPNHPNDEESRSSRRKKWKKRKLDSDSDKEKSEAELESCPICFGVFRDQDIGSPECCDHSFCLICIKEWAMKVNTCPVDRLPFTLILVRQDISSSVSKVLSVKSSGLVEEEPSVFCEVCEESGPRDVLLVCASCRLGAHSYCVRNPAATTLLGGWHCRECYLNIDWETVYEGEVNATPLYDFRRVVHPEPAFSKRSSLPIIHHSTPSAAIPSAGSSSSAMASLRPPSPILDQSRSLDYSSGLDVLGSILESQLLLHSGSSLHLRGGGSLAKQCPQSPSCSSPRSSSPPSRSPSPHRSASPPLCYGFPLGGADPGTGAVDGLAGADPHGSLALQESLLAINNKTPVKKPPAASDDDIDIYSDIESLHENEFGDNADTGVAFPSVLNVSTPKFEGGTAGGGPGGDTDESSENDLVIDEDIALEPPRPPSPPSNNPQANTESPSTPAASESFSSEENSSMDEDTQSSKQPEVVTGGDLPAEPFTPPEDNLFPPQVPHSPISDMEQPDGLEMNGVQESSPLAVDSTPHTSPVDLAPTQEKEEAQPAVPSNVKENDECVSHQEDHLESNHLLNRSSSKEEDDNENLGEDMQPDASLPDKPNELDEMVDVASVDNSAPIKTPEDPIVAAEEDLSGPTEAVNVLDTNPEELCPSEPSESMNDCPLPNFCVDLEPDAIPEKEAASPPRAEDTACLTEALPPSTEDTPCLTEALPHSAENQEEEDKPELIKLPDTEDISDTEDEPFPMETIADIEDEREEGEIVEEEVIKKPPPKSKKKICKKHRRSHEHKKHNSSSTKSSAESGEIMEALVFETKGYEKFSQALGEDYDYGTGWKRLSKTSKDRSYRDGKPKDEVVLFKERDIKRKRGKIHATSKAEPKSKRGNFEHPSSKAKKYPRHKSKDRARSKDHSPERSRNRSREDSRSRNRSREKSHSRNRSHERSRSRNRNRRHSRSRNHSKARSRSKTRNNQRRSRSRNHSRGRSRSRNHSRNHRTLSTKHGRSRSRGRVRNRSLERSKHRNTSRARSLSKPKAPSDKARKNEVSHSRNNSRTKSVEKPKPKAQTFKRSKSKEKKLKVASKKTNSLASTAQNSSNNKSNATVEAPPPWPAFSQASAESNARPKVAAGTKVAGKKRKLAGNQDSKVEPSSKVVKACDNHKTPKKKHHAVKHNSEKKTKVKKKKKHTCPHEHLRKKERNISTVDSSLKIELEKHEPCSKSEFYADSLISKLEQQSSSNHEVAANNALESKEIYTKGNSIIINLSFNNQANQAKEEGFTSPPLQDEVRPKISAGEESAGLKSSEERETMVPPPPPAVGEMYWQESSSTDSGKSRLEEGPEQEEVEEQQEGPEERAQADSPAGGGGNLSPGSNASEEAGGADSYDPCQPTLSPLSNASPPMSPLPEEQPPPPPEPSEPPPPSLPLPAAAALSSLLPNALAYLAQFKPGLLPTPPKFIGGPPLQAVLPSALLDMDLLQALQRKPNKTASVAPFKRIKFDSTTDFDKISSQPPADPPGANAPPLPSAGDLRPKGPGDDHLPTLDSTTVDEKFLQKLNRQERVIEEVKLVLKPFYNRREIGKEDYKAILRKSVPKICHNRTQEINPIKIKHLIEGYVKKYKYLRKKLRNKPD